MAANLIIVESPAKAKTIEKYLGKDFKVLASYGHVRDLIPKEGAVDPSQEYRMQMQLIERNAKHVETIAKAAKQAKALYLATDPDREGEAISYDVYTILNERKLLTDKPVYRVVFHEITKTAVNDAVAHPRHLDIALVEAQRARRILDYLVGFNLSPLLWRKIRRGLSAGRVQSPALRLIVERELEIEKFEAQEYWSVIADCLQEQQLFNARLVEYQGEKIEQFTINNENHAQQVKENLLALAQGKLLVSKVEKKQRKRNPSPPFITSTLQQEAARKLGFTTKRTMSIAQQLYEGIDVGQGAVGLITYMRTDSVNLAQEAVNDLRHCIATRYGQENLPDSPNRFKTKSKNAQEAHEAIRPTDAERYPENLKPYLSAEQFKLYDLIWKRTVACQMIHATINTVAVDLTCGEGNRFRATGSTIANPGFILVYQETKDDVPAGGDGDEKFLPPMREGDLVELQQINANQHFTEPPPRFSEASLVKALEERGIGRPSTYASIISTLQNREYVILDKKRFYPTDVGRVVNRFLTQYFTRYVDYDFTAQLEDRLDAISRGEEKWIPALDDFWYDFKKLLDETQENVQRKDVTQELMDEKCPKCEKQLAIRLGKSGRFIGCTGYPDCDYTRNIQEDVQEETKPEIIEGRDCPECHSPLQVRTGRYGKFIGCTNYPKCRHIESIDKPKDMNVLCPKCHKGNMVERKSRRGKIFYSCARYPKCDYALWDKPISEICPDCNWPILTIKVSKRSGAVKCCPQPDCKFSEPYDLPEGEG